MNNSLRCVIDASVGIKQFIPDLLSDKVKQLFSYLNQPNTEFFVPDLFYIESTNILWKYVRAGLYSVTDVPKDLADLKSLSLQVVATAELMESAFEIAHNHQISAYNGAYVALSNKVKAPLLTLDKKLINALSNTSYDIHSFTEFTLPF